MFNNVFNHPKYFQSILYCMPRQIYRWFQANVGEWFILKTKVFYPQLQTASLYPDYYAFNNPKYF